MWEPQNRTEEDHATSYKSLRRSVGALGFLLPFSLIVAGIVHHDIEPSISHYYYTEMGDVLVGSLAAIAIFLGSYRGYVPQHDEWISDHKLALITAAAALGVALFPSDGFLDRRNEAAVIETSARFVSGLHFASAAIFLISLGCFALFKFTRSATPKSAWTAEKKRENRIYIASGLTIFAAVIAIAAIKLIDMDNQWAGPFPDWMFWLETLAVWAFALSWLVKGETLEAAMRMLSPSSDKP
ncbi:MAG: hypothetical protein KDA67_02215 [Rhodobacteraceae bacterium]|nr:hypothetical protein [Paracoccaceae bacterium]